MTNWTSPRFSEGSVSASIGIAVLLAAFPCLGETFAGPMDPSLRVGSPSSHRYLGARGTVTSSWLEKPATWTTDGVVSFTYFVDSEEQKDELIVLVDGDAKFRVSGRERTGRAAVSVPPGTHVVRFAYNKNADTDVGLDRGWIDDVQLVAATHAFETYSFESPDVIALGGWSSGGDLGGWELTYAVDTQVFRRPRTMAFAGYQPAGRRAAISRRFRWPTTSQNALTVGYFIDCEPDNDALRILLDGAEVLRVSGANRRGIERIPVLTGGEHEVTIEYAKDSGVDQGRDEARIDLLLPTANGVPFSTGGLAAATPGQPPPGWEVPSWADFGGWEVVSLASTRAEAAQLDVARSVDGAATSDEYIAGYWFAPNHTAQLKATRPSVRLAAAVDGTLFLHVELPDDLGVWFMSGGELDLLIDADQINTSMGFGCGDLGSSPGLYARRIVLSIDEATTMPSLTNLQQIGTCLTGEGENWRDATAGESWSMVTAMGVDDEDGTVTLELSILPVRPSGVDVTAPIGIQLNVDATLPGIGVESILRLPWKPNRSLSWRNAATWQPVFFRTGELVPST